MNATRRVRVPQQVAGQTLVIAIIILGVLLILGVAFATIINRNIESTGRSVQQTVGGDLAKAGADAAHYQMLNSAKGADWRPQPSAFDIDGAGFSRDPDALYLRAGTGLPVAPDPARPGYTIVDLGGPDYLGAYSRIEYNRGRALVRVRYAPQNFGAMASPSGGFRDPGATRSHLVIESVGRPGRLRTGNPPRLDPSVLLSRAVQVAGFADGAAVVNGVGALKASDRQVAQSRRLLAVASIGLIESARYITNKFKVSRPAEIGFPLADPSSPFWADNVTVGATYEGLAVQAQNVYGALTAAAVPGFSAGWDAVPGGGSLWSNASVLVHGTNNIALNRTFGEMWASTGEFRPANSRSTLGVQTISYDRNTDTWVPNDVALPGNAFASNNPNFSTLSGVIRDGIQATDQNGFVRSISRKEPPSVLGTSPTNNRYDILTSQSGRINENGQNIGRLGYGRGVFVDSSERANRASEESRVSLDPSKSLPNDWLNPNNGDKSSGWQGPYYIPVAPYLHLLPDGFEITRDSRSANRFWRNWRNARQTAWNDPQVGARGNISTVRYWVRYHAADNRTYIINSIFAPLFDNRVSDDAFRDFTVNGIRVAQEFNGVLQFAGDVRTRGVIPTDVQLTVVSRGTVYVEGSITKGTSLIGGAASPIILARPSRSTLMLMAQDYVTLNTTQFFAPAPGEAPEAKNADNLADTPNPVELGGTKPEMNLWVQFLLNQNGLGSNPFNPSTWVPFAQSYTQPVGAANPGARMNTNLLFSVSADDNGPSFFSLDVAPLTSGVAVPSTSYLFNRTITFNTAPTPTTLFANAAEALFGTPGKVPVYGLGDAGINAYPKFETHSLPLFNAGPAGDWAAYSASDRRLIANAANPEGPFQLAMQEPTAFRLRLNPVGTTPAKNLLVARTAVTPHDIRIEAALFAEEGSFFVIPGSWFNSNPADTRTAFEQAYTPLDASDDLNVSLPDYGGGDDLALCLSRDVRP